MLDRWRFNIAVAKLEIARLQKRKWKVKCQIPAVKYKVACEWRILLQVVKTDLYVQRCFQNHMASSTTGKKYSKDAILETTATLEEVTYL